MNKINLGTTRLPRGERRTEALDVIRYAIDSGLTFIDASRGYWDIELVLAKALKNGYREKVILSSKWSPWIMKIEQDDSPTESCTLKRVEESLKRLEVDYLDYFLFWSQNTQEEFIAFSAKEGMLDGMLKAKEKGLVKHLGMSSHDKEENVINNLNNQSWMELIILPYNILNRNYEKALEVAHSKNIKTLVMNPLGGGSFLRNNIVINKIANKVRCSSVPELGIKFILSNINITGILSGISSKEDVDNSISFLKEGKFTNEQIDLINREIKELSKLEGFCTSCHYCMPCPKRIDIPSVMQSIFIEKYTGDKELAKENYSKIVGQRADACILCGKCEKKCTQKLTIMDTMKYIKEEYK